MNKKIKANIYAYLLMMFVVLLGTGFAMLVKKNINTADNELSNKDTLKYTQVGYLVNDGKCEFYVYTSDNVEKIVHNEDCRGCK